MSVNPSGCPLMRVMSTDRYPASVLLAQNAWTWLYGTVCPDFFDLALYSYLDVTRILILKSLLEVYSRFSFFCITYKTFYSGNFEERTPQATLSFYPFRTLGLLTRF